MHVLPCMLMASCLKSMHALLVHTPECPNPLIQVRGVHAHPCAVVPRLPPAVVCKAFQAQQVVPARAVCKVHYLHVSSSGWWGVCWSTGCRQKLAPGATCQLALLLLPLRLLLLLTQLQSKLCRSGPACTFHAAPCRAALTQLLQGVVHKLHMVVLYCCVSLCCGCCCCCYRADFAVATKGRDVHGLDIVLCCW